MVHINDNQKQLVELAQIRHGGEDFNHHRDGHRLMAGTFGWVNGEPVTVVDDNGVWIDWVPGHVELHTTNMRSLIDIGEPIL